MRHAVRDLPFSARPNATCTRVVLAVGAHRFTATRSESIELARQLVAAVDALAIPEGEPDDQ